MLHCPSLDEDLHPTEKAQIVWSDLVPQTSLAPAKVKQPASYDSCPASEVASASGVDCESTASAVSPTAVSLVALESALAIAESTADCGVALSELLQPIGAEESERQAKRINEEVK
ncbi:MAG: hypothetical protein NVSMB1_06110 [Polyangiales bacterium]